ERTRDAPSRPADADGAHDRHRPPPDSRIAGTHGTLPAAGGRKGVTPAPRFSRNTLSFLTRLKRNNRREWFTVRKDEYDAVVRQPMLAVLDRLAIDMRTVAPELHVSPKSMYRIYRDIRFSENKQPYKTHVAASFWHRTLGKGGGAGMYFHISPDGVWVGGGMYAPEPPQLHRVREQIANNVQQ